VGELRDESCILSRVGRAIENHGFDLNFLIEVSLESGFVVDLVDGLNDHGGAGRQSRVGCLEIENAVIDFVGVRGIEVAKDVHHDWFLDCRLLAGGKE
jgi:hypothetical protein